MMKLMYINGEFTQGNVREAIEVTNPATEEVLDAVPRGTAEDVDSAVRSSKEAFKYWQKMSANERATLLHEIASNIRNQEKKLPDY
jgi:acyl-CoA reductase-like NAD-dependent aldehyde dehydrogenase